MEQQSIDLGSVFVISHPMGKKNQTTLTNKESLRQASNRLERHIFQTNSQHIRKLIDPTLTGICFQTANTGTNLLLEIKKEALILRTTSVQDLQDLRQEIRRKQGLTDCFQDKLDLSMPSYERTYQIFKKLSLKQRYRHLLNSVRESVPQEQEKIDQPSLQVQESTALSKLKQLYRRYRVSNMYKKDVISRINRRIVERLIKKGCLQQNKDILSLTC